MNSRISTGRSLANVDPGLDLSSETSFGKILAIFADKFAELDALGAAVAASIDPANATGDLLVQRCALSATRPQSAQYSTVVATLTLNASVTVHPGAIAAVNGDPTNTWILTEDAVNPETTTQTVNALFRASQPGPIEALANTLTVIQTPTIGWTLITNPGDAIKGLAADTTETLRTKREAELLGAGSSDVDAIRARLLEIPKMLAVTVFQTSRSSRGKPNESS